MKVILLSDAEQFCREHNLRSISIDQLRDMAVDQNDTGTAIAYKAGYGKCSNVVIEAMAKERP